MHRLSQAPPGQQPPRRYSTRRPFELQLNGLPRFSTLASARLRAQAVADKEGRHIDIRDRDAGRWLEPVEPQRYLCPNRRCRRAVTKADWPEVWRTFRCAGCQPAPETIPMPRKRKHPIPDAGFWRCKASFAGSQSRCPSICHALEIDPAGEAPCGHLVQDHGCERVEFSQLARAVPREDRRRCLISLESWVFRADREKLIHPRLSHGRLLTTRPVDPPENELKARWALLWHHNPREAADELRRLIDERLNAEGQEVAA